MGWMDGLNLSVGMGMDWMDDWLRRGCIDICICIIFSLFRIGMEVGQGKARQGGITNT